MHKHKIKLLKLLGIVILFFIYTSCSNQGKLNEDDFKNPSAEYLPMPFWHINGELSTDEIIKQLKDAKEAANFSGVAVLPVSERKKRNKPGISPEFLSDEYFKYYTKIIKTAKKLNMEIILYDDIDFPSGTAGGQLEKLFPESTRKRLDKYEDIVKENSVFERIIPEGKLMSIVAMDTITLNRIELSHLVKNNILRWNVPSGSWKIMYFVLVKDNTHKKYLMVDYMDTNAVKNFMTLTYDVYEKKLNRYFGSTIKKIFFDDVGFFRYERGWTENFNDKFKELYNFDPKEFYPALWYDIGDQTESIRYHFFNTRAELLSEGFPKLVAQWAKENGLDDTGHPPGNYRITPIDMNGDIFKFYRYTSIPLTDAIIDYGVGRHGFKMISSAADFYDRPIVSTEIYGAFKEKIVDSLMLYRPLMELFTRGVNFVIPHGLWYDYAPNSIHISPLISPYSTKLADALPKYSEFVGRSCYLLQGGRRVSEIAVLYPFESLAGWFHFDAKDKKRYGTFVSPETDYHQISNLLTNKIRKDFTFVHPEFLTSDKYSIEKETIKLNNEENFQNYKIFIIPGTKIISYKLLEKLEMFYLNGGKIIATTQLPYKSSEMHNDKEVRKIISNIFGIDPTENINKIIHNKNNNGGRAVFLPEVNNLDNQINHLLPEADIEFSSNIQKTDIGVFSYIHKIRNDEHIFYFANSSDDEIITEVKLRGRYKLKAWNPHTGNISNLNNEFIAGESVTKINLKLSPVKSVFWVGSQQK